MVPILDALVNTEGGDYLDTGCGQALISDGIKRNLDLASSCSSYQGPMDHGRFSEGIGSRVLSKPPKVDCARVPDTSNIWGGSILASLPNIYVFRLDSLRPVTDICSVVLWCLAIWNFK